MKPLEVYVFYDPGCARCKRIHDVVKEARKKLGRSVKFINMSLAKPHVRYKIARKYNVSRIPALVPLTGEKPDGCDQLFWVGVPDIVDLVGVCKYLVIQINEEEMSNG